MSPDWWQDCDITAQPKCPFLYSLSQSILAAMVFHCFFNSFWTLVLQRGILSVSGKIFLTGRIFSGLWTAQNIQHQPLQHCTTHYCPVQLRARQLGIQDTYTAGGPESYCPYGGCMHICQTSSFGLEKCVLARNCTLNICYLPATNFGRSTLFCTPAYRQCNRPINQPLPICRLCRLSLVICVNKLLLVS